MNKNTLNFIAQSIMCVCAYTFRCASLERKKFRERHCVNESLPPPASGERRNFVDIIIPSSVMRYVDVCHTWTQFLAYIIELQIIFNNESTFLREIC